MPSIHPLQDPAVDRLNRRSVEISWRFQSDPVAVQVFEGPTPDSVDHHRPVAEIVAENRTVIDKLKIDRPHYFSLVADDAPALITAERRMPLEGAVNFRDIGGYRTVDGRLVKWGHIFRSDNMARLTDNDLKVFSHLNVKTVCDFRTEAEVRRSPNRLPRSKGARYCHMPIQHGENDPAATFERIKKGDYDWVSEEYMARGYVLSIENFSALWADFFNTLTSPDRRPFVFHCTAGKDRTGTAAALIFSVLGVADETIVHDYSLSAGYISGVLDRINQQLEEMGVDLQKVAPYLTVAPSRMRTLLEHIRETYGSASRYLVDKAGVDPVVIERFKADLLV